MSVLRAIEMKGEFGTRQDSFTGDPVDWKIATILNLGLSPFTNAEYTLAFKFFTCDICLSKSVEYRGIIHGQIETQHRQMLSTTLPVHPSRSLVFSSIQS